MRQHPSFIINNCPEEDEVLSQVKINILTMINAFDP